MAKQQRTKLKARARLYAQIRDFFQQRAVLEVETPISAIYGNPDPNIESMQTRYKMQGAKEEQVLYLQTSPEFAMKRLLAEGSGSIYQLCKVFRNGEKGRYHHPEFTLLEWYQLNYSLEALMQEVADLIQLLLNQSIPVCFYPYYTLFDTFLDLNVIQTTSSQLQNKAIELKLNSASELILDKNGWLDYLISLYIIPKLNPEQLSFIYHYPPEQASLAQIKASSPPVAERFELVYRGLELANGFHELRDPKEQLARFEQENQQRKAQNLSIIPLDMNLIKALEKGLPDCSGVALGIDRVLMIQQNVTDLIQVLTFSCLE